MAEVQYLTVKGLWGCGGVDDASTVLKDEEVRSWSFNQCLGPVKQLRGSEFCAIVKKERKEIDGI